MMVAIVLINVTKEIFHNFLDDKIKSYVKKFQLSFMLANFIFLRYIHHKLHYISQLNPQYNKIIKLPGLILLKSLLTTHY